MVGHGGSSAGSYLADPTSPIPSHCASIVAKSTLRVNCFVAISSSSSEETQCDHATMAEACDSMDSRGIGVKIKRSGI